MPEIQGRLDALTVDPKKYAPLKRFCCGKRGRRPEGEVHTIVREYCSGKRKGTFRVTLEQPDGGLVGVAAFHPGAFDNPQLQQLNSFPYISVIGVSEHYRSKYKNGARLGDAVLLDALREINRRWPGTPDVFALVDPNNQDSLNLFERNCFVEVIPAAPNAPEADAVFGRKGSPVP